MRELKPIERQRVERDYVTIKASCDRCGQDIPLQLRSGDTQDVPGVFIGDFKCERDEIWRAELCASCTSEVREFIDQGAGPGAQVAYIDPMGG